ncbi:hypothetical protein [Streptosporangium sp. NPDC087985]
MRSQHRLRLLVVFAYGLLIGFVHAAAQPELAALACLSPQLRIA